MNIILLYNLLNIILFPLYIILLLVRLFKGRENLTSLKSRFAIYKQKRRKKKIIWVHAASVGESMIAITLVNELKKNISLLTFLLQQALCPLQLLSTNGCQMAYTTNLHRLIISLLLEDFINTGNQFLEYLLNPIFGQH